MLQSPLPQPRIFLVGGDGRGRDLRVRADIRSFPSPRYAGNGSMRAAIAAIGDRGADLVVVLARWIGHTDFAAVAAACNAARVPIMVVPGGLSSVRRQVREYLQRCDHRIAARPATGSPDCRCGTWRRRRPGCRTVPLRRIR